MRWLVLVAALAGCGGDDDCFAMTGSRVSHRTGYFASSTDIVGVSWVEHQPNTPPLHHAAIVNADGTLEPDIRLGANQLFGSAGKTAVLWHASTDDVDCDFRHPFTTLLHKRGELIPVEVTPDSMSRSVAFDGVRFQMFWVVDEVAYHRTLDEDGTLGAIHPLGKHGRCVAAASNGNGNTFVRVGDSGYIIDPATGDLREIWTGAPFADRGPSFYFAGEFHVSGWEVFSVDPITRISRKRTLPESVQPIGYFTGASKLFVDATNGVVELDAAFSVVARFPRHPVTQLDALGTYGDDRLYLDQTLADSSGRMRLELVREGVTAWNHVIALDSPVETIDVCAAN